MVPILCQVWIADDSGRFIGTQGSFGTAHIENVLSAREWDSHTARREGRAIPHICQAVTRERGVAISVQATRFLLL